MNNWTTPPQLKKPLFIISFFRSYWPLLLVAAAFNYASHRDEITYWVGPTFYLFLLVILCLAATLLCKHLAFRRTIDAYTQQKEADGKTYTFVKEFWEMDGPQRVWLTVLSVLTFFLGAAWIAASIAK